MYIVDDPTLALISRFVGAAAYPDLSDAEFFRQQLAAIEAYVERFPVAERETQALAWIAANARQYRQQWQKQAAIDFLADSRCPDCPLSGGDQRTPCAIHRRWLKLLLSYAASELSSHDYITQSLALLSAFKDGLRVRHARDARLSTHTASDHQQAATATCHADQGCLQQPVPASSVRRSALAEQFIEHKGQDATRVVVPDLDRRVDTAQQRALDSLSVGPLDHQFELLHRQHARAETQDVESLITAQIQ